MRLVVFHVDHRQTVRLTRRVDRVDILGELLHGRHLYLQLPACLLTVSLRTEHQGVLGGFDGSFETEVVIHGDLIHRVRLDIRR